ncbi:hypothetical protein [Ancylobacter sp. SL191]|uniref:hypothetical protein n=1 Tax=Ancylobacter sp. SL191 TaxID=2995166 RepID=UPI00226E1C2D|nr:hypothetical protein [Ancylobacter sp. SL191]WAC27017.1 hypothetical protein OU996_18735 [Ancylobacter sp. SL191]
MEKIIAMPSAETPGGDIVTLYEVEDEMDAGTEVEPNKRQAGIRRMQLADGRVLTMVGHGEYRLAGTDEVFLVRGKDQGQQYDGVVLTPPDQGEG